MEIFALPIGFAIGIAIAWLLGGDHRNGPRGGGKAVVCGW